MTTLLSCIQEMHRSNTGPDTDCPAPACGLLHPLYQNAGSVSKFDHNQPSSPFWSVTIKQSSETLQWIMTSLNKLQLFSRTRMEHPGPAEKLSTNLYDIYQCWLYSEWTPDNGQMNCPKHVKFHDKINLWNYCI